MKRVHVKSEKAVANIIKGVKLDTISGALSVNLRGSVLHTERG